MTALRWAPALRKLAWLVERPIAHRGLHDAESGIVENTAGAFAAAMDRDYAIECDLQLSADGEAMVFHDAQLDRLTAETGPVIARTAAELQDVAMRGSNDRIQTLGELLDQVNARVPLVIELKSHWDGSLALARRTAEVVARYDGPLALMSFDPDVVTGLAELAPRVPRGIVADRESVMEVRLSLARRLDLRHLGHVDKSRPHFLSYHADGLPYGPPRAFRQAGLPVICWTVRDAATAARARRYADQITFEGYLP
ncbi:MAG TPA: glycerophosphodiester phosphodiesterase family protein [Aestuariivirgaceae bacterium]|nr:glycerophosphodiester phosphodiesterase family protein [Aestuariivirgaceae bacterium]